MRRSVVMSAFFPSSVRSEKALAGAMECVAAEAPSVDTFEFFLDQGYSPRIAGALRRLGKRSIFLAAVKTKRDYHDLAAADRDDRETAIRVVERCIDAAADYGSEAVLVNTGFAPPNPEDTAKALDALASSLESLLAYGERQGQGSRIELFMETGAMNRKGAELIGSTRTAAALAARLRASHPGFFLTIDTSHILQLGESPMEAITAAAGLTKHVHLANWVIGEGDAHPEFGAEGSELSHAAVAEICRKVGGILPSSEVLVGVEIICREPDERKFFNSIVKRLDWFLGNGKGSSA